jgi:uncharacterized protein (TIGR03083 family)
MDVFAAIADERRTVADMLSGLTPAQWATPSLCPPWNVREIAAHLDLPFLVGARKAMWAFVLARFDFDRWAERLTAEVAVRPTAELVDILRRNAEHRFVPPGAGPEAPLTEILVHGLDIRRPLGIARKLPEDRVLAALEFLAKAPPRGHTRKAWREGLRFVATDMDWAHGHGPLVRGGVDSLLLALTGRVSVLDEVQGDGVAELRRRFAGGR